MVPVGDVHDGRTVRDHEALEPPRVPKMILQQHRVGAGGVIINGVIGTHH